MSCEISIDGALRACHEGQALSTVLRQCYPDGFRDPLLAQRPTGPFCGMGACWECQVEVDGSAGVRSCLVRVRHGMVVRTDTGSREVAHGS